MSCTCICLRVYVCVFACTYASHVHRRVGVVHMDPHLLNASDDFFLMAGQIHAHSPQVPEKQHANNGHLFIIFVRYQIKKSMNALKLKRFIYNVSDKYNSILSDALVFIQDIRYTIYTGQSDTAHATLHMAFCRKVHTFCHRFYSMNA